MKTAQAQLEIDFPAASSIARGTALFLAFIRAGEACGYTVRQRLISTHHPFFSGYLVKDDYRVQVSFGYNYHTRQYDASRVLVYASMLAETIYQPADRWGYSKPLRIHREAVPRTEISRESDILHFFTMIDSNANK